MVTAIRVLLALLAPTFGNVAYKHLFPAGLGVAVSGLQLSKGRLVTVFLLGWRVTADGCPPGKQPVPLVNDRSGPNSAVVIASRA